jgi:hypothetical protein
LTKVFLSKFGCLFHTQFEEISKVDRFTIKERQQTLSKCEDPLYLHALSNQVGLFGISSSHGQNACKESME